MQTQVPILSPSARVADLLGLLTVLYNSFEGKTDIYLLEKELEVDIDDFMPIVYAANTLGFVTIGDGDIIITDKGIEFLKGNIRKRKELLRESLHKIEPFATAKELRKFKIDELLRKLEEKGITAYSGPTGYHDLQVILAEWGVYSGFLKLVDDEYEVTIS
ncbi:ABC transporter ATP-binding protein [Sulfolobus sp. S-194]|uniref:AAA-associated domain-containing protein n=1 Tax=Sulfolobus sp. S-194 TaxID=2512240 RepID=UPI001437315C|nr:AAA-associated domain-containing protein [Sulfolobus sp. S-194]QIW25103.1 ABC transporter ATP-binding protein [Sulfolobus sp. S-194]